MNTFKVKVVKPLSCPNKCPWLEWDDDDLDDGWSHDMNDDNE